MRYVVPLLMWSVMAVAQGPATPSPNLPDTLPELMAALPQAVRTYELVAFDKAFERALQKDPASAADSIPALGRDLQDPDREVRGMSLYYVDRFMRQPDGLDLTRPLANQLTQIIANDKSNQGLALELVTSWGPAAPDSLVTTIATLVQSRPESDDLTEGAVDALVFMRPRNRAVEDVVATLLTDRTVPLQTRREVLQHMAHWVTPLAGIRLIAAIDLVATSASDKGLRDDAISAAARIGLAALSAIDERLMQITRDPTESNASKELAKAALATE